MKLEKDLHRHVMRQCKRAGVFCQKTESRSARGFPDLILAGGGRVVFIELKSPSGTGRLSPLQLRRHREMIAAGLDVRVVDDPGVADDIIESLVEL